MSVQTYRSDLMTDIAVGGFSMAASAALLGSPVGPAGALLADTSGHLIGKISDKLCQKLKMSEAAGKITSGVLALITQVGILVAMGIPSFGALIALNVVGILIAIPIVLFIQYVSGNFGSLPASSRQSFA